MEGVVVVQHQEDGLSFKDIAWQPSYRTSARNRDGRLTDILNDFYIPVLQRAVEYDRVAGYFRSSSLAIASQGFSAFTGREGRMRLVVGADLELEDVVAILEGNNRRLVERLSQRLEGSDQWPENESRGVQLLAWMVAKGYLDVQVAFRVHCETGKPLPFQDVSDGYVHEKWAVFRDGHGNRLSISGSLNESKTALVLNAENIEVHADWWNDLERERTDRLETDFAALWVDRCPYLRVLPLPEAVRRRLIRLAEGIDLPVEIDGKRGDQAHILPPPPLERFRFALIKDGPRLPSGRYVGMETAPVSPWPHQEVVARRLIDSWPYSFLLCDEVGLGKTIEAGLAIRSLVLSGLAKRVLITAPASLTAQWQREMATKFLLPFARALTGTPLRHEYLFPMERVASATGLYQPNLCIVSTGLLARKDRRQDLVAARRFDIALVDEAHYARRQNPATADNRRQEPRFGRLYGTIRDEVRKRSEALWLATATPMQLDWIEVFDLIHLSDRVGAFQDDPTLTWSYYDILGRLIHNQPVREEEWQFLRRAIKAIGLQDPLLQQYLETAVIDGRIRACSKQWLEQERIPKGRDLVNIRRLIFAAAPLSRVMLRHTRTLLEIYKSQGRLSANLAKRTILPIPRIVFTPLEQQAYDKLEEYCDGLARQMQTTANDQSSVFNLKFLLSLLRLRFASSLYAIRETLRRRLERVEATLASFQQPKSEVQIEDFDVDDDDEDGEGTVIETLLKNRTERDLKWELRQLKQLLETLGDLHEMPSKMQTFLDVMNSRRLPGGRIRQTVVFTRFFDTLTDIVGRLRRIDPAMLIGTYSGRGGEYVDPATGKMVSVERDAIKQRFMREEIDVLVCTDAAAEGLNLQTADMLINFDLPWNPMKVEQRIGRIDRIGQKFEQIFVLNLCYAGSVEETVYGRLMERLRNAAGVVGTQQVSMLPISEEDFRLLASGALTEQELEIQARDRIILQQQRTASMEIPAQDLYDIYLRLGQQHKAVPSPVSLKEIWAVLTESSFLRSLGCQISADGRLMTIKGVTGVIDGSLLTVDRVLYDKGLPGESRPIHFASYGDPVFEAILQMVEQFDLPATVRRLAVQEEGIVGEMVGYAVLESADKGADNCRLVCSMADSDSLVLTEDGEALLEDASSTLIPVLQRKLTEEGGPSRAAEHVTRSNRRAALAQQRFSLYVAHRLLSSGDIDGEDPFYPKINGMAEQFDSGDMVPVYNLSVSGLQEIQSDLMFDISVPKVGRVANIRVPSLLAKAAVDAACRVADSFRRRRREITVGEVLERLGKEIEKYKALMR